ncbi:MAG: hypothetical protein WCO21_00615 [bacterium]
MNSKNNLLMFYGQGCVHCEKMMPLVEQLELEHGVSVQKLETWQNADNDDLRKKYDIANCDGVPYFFNTKTEKFICGEADYTDLIVWATAE